LLAHLRTSKSDAIQLHIDLLAHLRTSPDNGRRNRSSRK
jgi:hypothetical protein